MTICTRCGEQNPAEIHTCTPPLALRLADAYEATGLRGHTEAAAELRRLHAENEKLLAVLEEAEYALDYASDMTKPEGLSGCDCPICTASIRIGDVLAGKRGQA